MSLLELEGNWRGYLPRNFLSFPGSLKLKIEFSTLAGEAVDRNVGRSMRWPLANASPKHGRVEDNGEGRRGVYEGGGRFIGDTALNRQSQSDLPLNPSPFSPAPQVNESRAHNASVDRSIRDNGPGRGWHGSFTLPPPPTRKSLFLFTEGVKPSTPLPSWRKPTTCRSVFAKMTHFLHRLILAAAFSRKRNFGVAKVLDR